MNTQKLLFEIHDADITSAIQALEQKTSGELRVFITSQPTDDALAAAWKAFARLGMHRTNRRNSVLIFVAPEAQKFALIHDEGYAGKTTPDFWQTLATQLHTGFKSGAYTATLVQVLAQCADHMAQHFPHQPGDNNELPNTLFRE
jgi:uncharacterized membrane protein